MMIPDPEPKSASGEMPVVVSQDAILGKELFGSKGCVACHQPIASTIAPSLVGVYGTERKLTSGETVVADEAYLKESILFSNAKTAEGYAPSMPGYDGVFSDEEVEQLIAYIKSIK